jgi:hypothetical protein
MRIALYSAVLFALSAFVDAHAQTSALLVNPERCRPADRDANRPRPALNDGLCQENLDCGAGPTRISCRPIRSGLRSICPEGPACMREFQKTESARSARISNRGGEAPPVESPLGGERPATSSGSASD